MLAEKPWNLEAAGRLFLGVITTFCLGAVVGGLLSHFTSGWPKGQSDFWQIVVSAAFLQLPAFVWIGLFLRQQNVSWREAFGFRLNNSSAAVAYGILTGVLFVPAAWGLQILCGKLLELLHLSAQDQQMVQELQDSSLTLAEKFFLGVIALVFAPMVEELLFRGILYPALKKLGRPGLALWGSSALFALAHCNMASFVPLLFFAVVLVALYESTQNLLAPIVAHSLFNTANFLVLIFQDQIGRALHLP